MTFKHHLRLVAAVPLVSLNASGASGDECIWAWDDSQLPYPCGACEGNIWCTCPERGICPAEKRVCSYWWFQIEVTIGDKRTLQMSLPCYKAAPCAPAQGMYCNPENLCQAGEDQPIGVFKVWVLDLCTH